MIEYFEKLFEATGFMPHGHCYFWKPDILAANLVGDGLTALAYFSIPLTLVYFTRKRQDLGHKLVFTLFALFIFFCGATHLIEMVTIWTPIYRLQGLLKVLTGLVSVATAIVLFRSVPRLLAIPSQASQEEINQKLREEVAERERAQVALREANSTLETRVQQRTSQLIKINRELEKEIEQRKMTEQELKEKNQELVRINSDLDNFVYCATADLKAPIVNIEGLVTALKEEIPQRSHHVEEILHRLDGSLLQVDRTVLDLTEVSRLQNGGLEAAKEQLQFAEVLEEVKLEIADLIAKTKATIQADFSAAPTIELARQDLKSILYNLLTNAIKYHAPDRLPSVVVQSEVTTHDTILRVSDNGIGIDLPKHERKIFALFRRLSENLSGSGIGLYIIKRILDNYQGQIQVKSTPGEGSTFEVLFPRN